MKKILYTLGLTLAGLAMQAQVTAYDSIVMHPSCGANNGWAYVYAFGGTEPYTYIWSPSVTLTSDNESNSLSAGTYTVIVKDATNASDTLVFTLNTNMSAITTFPIYAKCADGFGALQNGFISSYLSYGTAPYSYQWSSSNSAGGQGNTADSVLINNLEAGTYAITITDAIGCLAVTTIDIAYCDTTTPDTLGLSAYVNYDCYYDSIANIVAFGSTGYSYAWSGNGTYGTTSYIYPIVENTTYYFTVSDANGATFSNSFFAYSCDSIDSIYNTPLSAWAYSYCYDYYYDTISGGTTGAWAYGGTYPYTYSWSNGQTGEYLYNAVNGTYVVTVTDAAGATATATVDVNCTNTTPSCEASFFTYNDSIDPSTVYLINTSVGQNIAVDFGDGTPFVAADSAFTHVYANPGTYNVCVYAWGWDSTWQYGCSDTICGSLTVAKTTTPIRQVKVIRPVINAQTTGIKEQKEVVSNVILYPNPSALNTTIAYELKEASRTTINVVDLVGKNVMSLDAMNQQAGSYVKEISTANLANGTYFVQLTTNTTVKNIKLMVNH